MVISIPCSVGNIKYLKLYNDMTTLDVRVYMRNTPIQKQYNQKKKENDDNLIINMTINLNIKEIEKTDIQKRSFGIHPYEKMILESFEKEILKEVLLQWNLPTHIFIENKNILEYYKNRIKFMNLLTYPICEIEYKKENIEESFKDLDLTNSFLITDQCLPASILSRLDRILEIKQEGDDFKNTMILLNKAEEIKDNND